MEIINLNQLKDLWWLGGILLFIILKIGEIAVRSNKGKEQQVKVGEHDKSINQLKSEMKNIKGDITEIKEGVDRQGNDTAAMMKCLQSIMNALYENDCNIGPARDRFNDYLSDRQ